MTAVSSRHIVVTLVEGDFIYGAMTLLNSLVRNGFSGRFIVGVRTGGTLPFNAVSAVTNADIPGVEVEVRPVDTSYHFTNYKPTFMQDVARAFADSEKITYMDPDIVVCCPFAWIDSWCDGGPVVCGDVNWMMPADHPTRHAWLAISGLKARRRLDVFFNGGFLSVRRVDLGFLELWAGLIANFGSRDNALDAKGDISKWRHGGRWLPFFSPNQDTLNLAAMVWEGNLTTLGPDVMGFIANGILPHALGVDKPWRKAYLSQALCGTGPSQADKMFWEYADSPVQVFPWWKVAAKRVAVAAAAALARFYRRS